MNLASAPTRCAPGPRHAAGSPRGWLAPSCRQDCAGRDRSRRPDARCASIARRERAGPAHPFRGDVRVGLGPVPGVCRTIVSGGPRRAGTGFPPRWLTRRRPGRWPGQPPPPQGDISAESDLRRCSPVGCHAVQLRWGMATCGSVAGQRRDRWPMPAPITSGGECQRTELKHVAGVTVNGARALGPHRAAPVPRRGLPGHGIRPTHHLLSRYRGSR
jgi:hypothetical protein